ncbi:MAG: hypothetical protein JF625_19540 [Inquilinus limosus]|uniref:Uncharacterized protein n=1 Tax=Inquilinus limosus TaxID=171674 RepID=A0A952KF78_9PROT|nr:hypothetical protein [Inquilinus limosus]
MAKRSTVQNNPLGPARTVADDSRTVFSSLKNKAHKTLGWTPRRTPAERAGLAAGGRLELLGGDFGTGIVSIRRLGPDGLLAFVAPGGEEVVLDTEVAAVLAWPDRQEHRFLSAGGWAWTVGSVIGPVGVALGAGIRLLHPAQRMLNLRLRDGRELVARTDSVTVAGLDALARAAGADAASHHP